MTPLDYMRADIGQKEAPGAANNPVIVAKFARCGHPEVVTDSTYWCAAEIGDALVRSGYPCSRPRADNLMARSYKNYGVTIPKSAKAIQKALDEGHFVIAVWPRGAPPSGHVNAVEHVNVTKGTVDCIDGNVSDQVIPTKSRSIKDAVCFVRPLEKLLFNIDMRLDAAGESFIKEAEEDGGRPALTAYNDGTGKWTIGWGCTDGVKQGMRITEAQAQALFDYEIVACEDAVHRLVTRKISQGLFNALVSFFFNCGWNDCSKLLAAVNGGDETKIRAAFMLYVNATNGKTGKKEPWPGLVKRRTAEIDHWLSVDHASPEGQQAVAAWAPAEAPDKPGVVATLSLIPKLRGVAAQVVAWVLFVFGLITQWLQDAVDKVAHVVTDAPTIVSDTQTNISVAQQLSEWFRLNWGEISLWVIGAMLTIAIIRSLLDGREAA